MTGKSRLSALVTQPDEWKSYDESGVTMLGAGAFSRVYAAKSPVRVRKMFRPDNGYEKYLAWLKSTKVADKFPFFPRVLCHYQPVAFNQVAKLERLTKLYDNADMFTAISGVIYAMEQDMWTVRSVKAIPFRAYEGYNGALDDETTAGWIRFLLAIVNGELDGTNVDLHTGNVMLRGDQLVLTDPFCG